MAIFDHRGRCAERLAARIAPIGFERTVFGNDELHAGRADYDIERAVRSEAVRWYPDLFELAGRHPARGRERREGLVDRLDLARTLQVSPQTGEAADTRCSRHQAERVNGRIAEHEREIGEMLRRE